MKKDHLSPSEMGKKGWANSYGKLSAAKRREQARKGGLKRWSKRKEVSKSS